MVELGLLSEPTSAGARAVTLRAACGAYRMIVCRCEMNGKRSYVEQAHVSAL